MIIARVNDYDILDCEYQTELRKILENLHLDQPTPDIKKRAISQLIDAYLLLNKARQSDISISPEDIEQRFIDFTLDFKDQDEFYQALTCRNLDENTLREKIQNELYIKTYVQKNFPLSNDIPLDKLHEVYLENREAFTTQEMVKASHILIRGCDSDCHSRIAEIRSRIKSPQDFEKEARICSECPSACQAGDLGYFPRGKMVKEFEDMAFSLAVEEISPPVKTQFGYHLIMVTEHRKSKITSFEEVRDALSQRVQQIDSELRLISHLKELRALARIEIFDELL